MSAKCQDESIELQGDDLARMRDCSSYQRHLATKLKMLTRPAMISTIFDSFKPTKGRLQKKQYSEYVQLVASYEPLNDARWREECAVMRADSRRGVTLEEFCTLYAEREGSTPLRNIKEDYAKLFAWK